MLPTDLSTADAFRHLHRAEPDDRLTLDRRRFLQLVGMGVGAGLVSSGPTSLLDHLLLRHDASAWAAGPVASDQGVLVVICMFGGNDGLNTVVPIDDGNYYTQHRSLAVPGASVLPIGSGLGLHPNLPEFKRLWDAGQLAIVDGVGYPNPDLSHFTSMARWMSAKPTGLTTDGWIGRWLDGYLGGRRELFAAAEIGSVLPLHLNGSVQRGTVVPEERPEIGAAYEVADQRLYRSMRAFRSGASSAWGAAVCDAFSDQLDLAANVAPLFPGTLPGEPLTRRLEIAARLINANLGLRVLTASWIDFDSHALQHEMHPSRMNELNAAVARFFQVLEPAWSSRVTLMTFSEFGRTSWANDGNGTDHGSAAPHFVFGQNVKGGLYGQRPTLSGLGRWDRMQHHVDFRSYYTSVIDGWLGGGASEVLGGSFEDLGLFARPPGYNADGSLSPGPAPVTEPSTFVPVAPFRLFDSRDGTGGLTRPLTAGERIGVQITGIGEIPNEGVIAVVANVTSTDVSEPNFFTVYPGETIRPATSNLNGGPGRPVPNLVVMGVGSSGTIEVYNSHGTAHCLVDVFGYFTAANGDRLTPVSPSRLFDTRTGQGIRPGKIPSSTPVDVQVAGLTGVPASGATAVVMNLTVTEPDSPGWMRSTPAGQQAASTSNLNYMYGNTVCNLVICKIGDGGRITIDGFGDGAHVIGDVFGYFSSSGRRLRTLPPSRLLDTREGLGAPKRQVGPGVDITLPVGGRGRVPRDASAVILNVTATNVGGPTFVTVWPTGEPRPDTSNLNVVGGQTVANLVICRLGFDSCLQLASPVANVDLIADVLGYYTD
jgi:uncharacterized protein (DUF1501 family)